MQNSQQFEVPQKPFKPAYKPGTVLCMHHKATNSFRVVEVLNEYKDGFGAVRLDVHCLASSYEQDPGRNLFGFLLNNFKIQVISEPSE